jgi:hypothetical protein
MTYKSLPAPAFVRTGFLSMSEALGIVSLLPLSVPTDPEILLQQSLLDDQIQALLVDEAGGGEYPIPSQFWQTTAVAAAFRELRVRAPVKIDGGILHRSGWIIFDAHIIRRAICPLLKQPELPLEASATLKDPSYKHLVFNGIQKAKGDAFDEAVRQWRTSGEAAQAIERPVFTAKIESHAARIARLAELQKRSMSLGSVPGGAPDLASPATDPSASRAPLVIDGVAKRIETPTANIVTGPDKARQLRDLKAFLEPLAAQLGGNPPQSKRPKFADLRQDAEGAIKREVPRDTLRDLLDSDFPNLKRGRGRSVKE